MSNSCLFFFLSLIILFVSSAAKEEEEEEEEDYDYDSVLEDLSSFELRDKFQLGSEK